MKYSSSVLEADAGTTPAGNRTIKLVELKARYNLRQMISTERGTSLSRFLNTQGTSLRDLRLVVADRLQDQAFRRAI